MLQIAAIVAGLIAVVMGIAALSKGQIQLSRNKQLTGSGARAVGVGIVVFGVAICVFALLGIPWLAGDPSIFSSTAASQSPATSDLPEQPAPIVQPDNRESQWERHATPDGLCSAEFPNLPESVTMELAGRSLERMQLQRAGGLGHYALSTIPLPEDEDSAANEVIDEWRDNHLALSIPGAGQFTLIDDSKVEVDGITGRKINLQAGPDKVSLNRMFVVEGRIYRANVVIDTVRKGDADVRRFLESIQFER